MRWRDTAWGCVNSPAYRRTWLAHARAALEAGIDWFIVDDPRINEAAVAWGGCFCPDCRDAAAREGTDLARDIAAFQRRSVTRFHQEMRAAIDVAAGRHVTFASNNVRGSTGWPYDLFDFGIAEIDPRDALPDALAAILRNAEMAGRPQVLALRSDDVELNQRLIAWCYAHGGHLLAPWDVYLRSTVQGSERFYGRAEDFAPLYAFARAMAPLLDRAIVPAEAPAGAWQMDRPGWKGSLRTASDGGLAALHLVPWQAGVPARLMLDAAALLPGVSRVRLLGPDGLMRQLAQQKGRSTMTWEGIPPTPWLVVEMIR